MSSKVLSIQSHVVAGYVGNRAATFPLQLLGLEVDVINTVQFSNHTGYNTFHGERFPASHILDLFAGIKENGLDTYTHLLTGYMGNSENIRAVESIANELLAKNPDLFFVLDPVMGDEGALYVPKELIALYRDVLCPMAKLVTPNQFEAELLTGVTISTLEDAKKACDVLHSYGIPNVVITSSVLEDAEKPVGKQLHLVGSEIDEKTGAKNTFRISFPRLDGYFTGSGDFFAALTTARLAKLRSDGAETPLERACELATSTQVGIMAATRDFQESTGVPVGENLARGTRPSDMVRGFEMRIIPSQHLILNPTLQFKADKI